MKFDPPIYITVRDRVSDLKELVAWLEKAGHERIILLNNASTYPPLLEYLAETPHQVVHFEQNLGSRALWRSGILLDEEFVLTDPDVLPIDDCPLEAIRDLHELLSTYPQFPKAGLGLYLEDTPPFQSLAWEQSLVSEERFMDTIGPVPVPRVSPPLSLPSGRLVDAPIYNSMIDTTLALHQPYTRHLLQPAIRLGYPYQMRHLPWYRLGEPSEEERYYLDHAIKGPLGSSWAEGKQ